MMSSVTTTEIFTGGRSGVSQSKQSISDMGDYKSFKFIEETKTMKDTNSLMQENIKKSNKSQCNIKGTMEYDLPELVVFLQEESYHFVKDICIDKEKCLVEDCELDHKIISCILESDGSDEIKREMRSQNTMVRLESKTNEDDDEYNHKVNKEIVPESLLLVGEVQKAVLTSSMVPLTVVEKNEESRQISTTILIPEEAEKRRISCCDSDSSMSSKSGADELLLGPGCHQQDPYVVPIPTGLESQQSFKEESSLFGSGHFSGLITHHGIAAPSFRSTSHLSNSSTTSSRSFAFPVLAAEWHGSPDRMARSENRKLEKRKGKCVRFLCCKF